jgi:hypothetical protein
LTLYKVDILGDLVHFQPILTLTADKTAGSAVLPSFFYANGTLFPFKKISFLYELSNSRSQLFFILIESADQM